MISKAGSRTYERAHFPSRHPRLSTMERCLLKWAVIDRDDRVLDVGLGNGLMAANVLKGPFQVFPLKGRLQRLVHVKFVARHYEAAPSIGRSFCKA